MKKVIEYIGQARMPIEYYRAEEVDAKIAELEQQRDELARLLGATSQQRDKAVNLLSESTAKTDRVLIMYDELAQRFDALEKERDALAAQLKDFQALAAILGSAWYHGNFKPETYNEEKMLSLMNKIGFVSSDEESVIELIEKYAGDADLPADGS